MCFDPTKEHQHCHGLLYLRCNILNMWAVWATQNNSSLFVSSHSSVGSIPVSHSQPTVDPRQKEMLTGTACLFTAPVVARVVSSTAAAAYFLYLWDTALPWGASLTTSNKPECVTAVALCMANTLAAFALQTAFQGDVPLQDFQRMQIRHIWSLHYRHNKVWG